MSVESSAHSILKLEKDLTGSRLKSPLFTVGETDISGSVDTVEVTP